MDKIFQPSGGPIEFNQLELYLFDKTYISGQRPTQADVLVYKTIVIPPDSVVHPNVSRWYSHIKTFEKDFASLPFANLGAPPSYSSPRPSSPLEECESRQTKQECQSDTESQRPSLRSAQQATLADVAAVIAAGAAAVAVLASLAAAFAAPAAAAVAAAGPAVSMAMASTAVAAAITCAAIAAAESMSTKEATVEHFVIGARYVLSKIWELVNKTYSNLPEAQQVRSAVIAMVTESAKGLVREHVIAKVASRVPVQMAYFGLF